MRATLAALAIMLGAFFATATANDSNAAVTPSATGSASTAMTQRTAESQVSVVSATVTPTQGAQQVSLSVDVDPSTALREPGAVRHAIVRAPDPAPPTYGHDADEARAPPAENAA